MGIGVIHRPVSDSATALAVLATRRAFSEPMSHVISSTSLAWSELSRSVTTAYLTPGQGVMLPLGDCYTLTDDRGPSGNGPSLSRSRISDAIPSLG